MRHSFQPLKRLTFFSPDLSQCRLFLFFLPVRPRTHLMLLSEEPLLDGEEARFAHRARAVEARRARALLRLQHNTSD